VILVIVARKFRDSVTYFWLCSWSSVS